MDINNTRTLGYDGPLGWPDIDPSNITNTYITSGYERTTAEKASVDMDSETTDWASQDNNDGDNLYVYQREILNMRYKIDEMWETLATTIKDFSATYLKSGASTSSSNFNISTTDEYNTAMGKVLQMQAYASVLSALIEQLYATAESEKYKDYDVFSIIDNSQRNLVGGGYSTYNFANKLFAALMPCLVDSNTTEEEMYASLEETGEEAHKNRLTTANVKTAFSKYQTWINNIQSSLKTFAKSHKSITFEYEGDFPKENANVSSTENAKQFQQNAYILDAMLCKDQIRSVWVFLQIGNIKFSTWNNSCYISDFDYVKNGSGTANAFTFTLVYNPPPGDSDINKLEKILSKRTVFFQYGYNESQLLCSPQYSGQILEYSVSSAGNVLTYTIKGYSEAANERNNNISVPGYGSYLTNDDGEQGDMSYGVKATEYARMILSSYLGSYGYKVVVEEEADAANTDTVIEAPPQGNVFECAQNILSQAVLTPEIEEKINSKKTNSGNDDSNTNVENTSYFTYVIDDVKGSDGYKTITIKRALKLSELSDTENIPSVVFAYGGKEAQIKSISSLGADLSEASLDNNKALIDFYKQISATASFSKGTYKMLSNIVLDFSTKYDGSVTIASAYEDANTQISIRSDGTLVVSNGLGSQNTTGETSYSDERYSYWLWERNTMFSYEASLTMVGMPSDIPIGTYIYIRPLINGYEHHTGGFYYITGSEDKVTQQGYTTTLSLVKVIDAKTDDILDLIERRKKQTLSRAQFIAEYKAKYGDQVNEDGIPMAVVAANFALNSNNSKVDQDAQNQFLNSSSSGTSSSSKAASLNNGRINKDFQNKLLS